MNSEKRSSGDRIVAYVVQKEKNELTKSAVRLHCKKYLADYKIPREVFFVSQLEKNANGKVLKKYL